MRIKKENKKRIVFLLDKIFKLHELFKKSENNKNLQIKILRKSEPILIELESLGIKKAFSSTLLGYGDEFLKAEFRTTWEKMREKHFSN